MRLDACLTVMRCLDESLCFWAADFFSFWWCAVWAVERWNLKDAGG
jgi:hypothetical protein